MHPHRLEDPQSNRTPTSAELKIGKLALQKLVEEFPSAKVVAVGRKAEGLLKWMNIPRTYVHHPVM
jgi:hypothetical protein